MLDGFARQAGTVTINNNNKQLIEVIISKNQLNWNTVFLNKIVLWYDDIAEY